MVLNPGEAAAQMQELYDGDKGEEERMKNRLKQELQVSTKENSNEQLKLIFIY